MLFISLYDAAARKICEQNWFSLVLLEQVLSLGMMDRSASLQKLSLPKLCVPMRRQTMGAELSAFAIDAVWG
ncbi:hypothetical protein [Synechococcus elongatus]|uniref:hypothetical protein n=1 Tax=Synechococcus elongatus TaxID=32046 RepID=UPI000F7E29C6|nr:hypothetical protein [Synechococcus elongatus]